MTPEDKTFIKEEYILDPTKENIDFLSKKFSVSNRSIITILNAAGLYKKTGYITKTGERPVNKQELVELISRAMGVHSLDLEGLEKTNKNVLRLILKHIDPESDKYFVPEYK